MCLHLATECQKTEELEVDESTNVVGNFNTPLLVHDRSNKAENQYRQS